MLLTRVSVPALGQKQMASLQSAYVRETVPSYSGGCKAAGKGLLSISEEASGSSL